VLRDQRVDESILVQDAPAILGLSFRGFRGEADYPAMSAVISGSKDADGHEWAHTFEDIARNYRHLAELDPERDMLFAEVEGRVIGYSRVWWSQEDEGTRLYRQFVHLLPEWRVDGLRRAMLRHNERRLREVAAGHPDDGPRFFEAFASATETDWATLLRSESYQGVRYGFEMVRPDLENIPDLPLLDGLEVRPVEPEHIPQIWAAAKEAFRDHWGFCEEEWDRELAEWQEAPTFQPHLWQVAWDGDQVAGMVQNFVNEAENEEYGRKRGYTEGISVRRPWRRQGVAKALIAHSFRLMKELGMEEAALGVDADNPNGALQLYRSMGFQEVKRHTTYRKPLELGHAAAGRSTAAKG
jgi:mycothiol synthase